MDTERYVYRKTTVRRGEDFADAFIVIDISEIAQALGPRAMRSKGKLATALMRYGATLGAIAERECNGHQTPDGNWDEKAAKRDEAKETRIREKVTALCARYGCKPVFQGDPRGNTLKIAVPDGYTNDWGREGICVPTS